MKKIMILFAFLVLISCEDKKELEFFKTYDESELIQKQQEHQIPRMKFKLFQSKVLNMNTIFKPFNDVTGSMQNGVPVMNASSAS